MAVSLRSPRAVAARLFTDRRPRAAVAALAWTALCATTDAARADDPPQDHVSLLDRSHTVAEAEAGIIALPNAPISPASRGGNTPLGAVGNGDATVQTGVHILYRADRNWAVGAGAIFAPHPTSDPNCANCGGASGLSRTHSRSYLFLGGEGRYYPFRSRWLEGWVGLTGGTIVVADRFTTTDAPQVPSLLGTNQVTVSTAGFALGGQAGLDYLITDSLVVGLALRGDWWLLPDESHLVSSCDAIGDCPTLHGSVSAFELGLTVGYRIPL
jgi:hypothetical protein